MLESNKNDENYYVPLPSPNPVCRCPAPCRHRRWEWDLQQRETENQADVAFERVHFPEELQPVSGTVFEGNKSAI
jgi:hypothetical protein